MTIQDYIYLDKTNQPWIKTGPLMVNLSSMQNGFLDIERHRREIWDYIQYRESLLQWPSFHETVNKSA